MKPTQERTLASSLPALRALMELAEAHPTLPAATLRLSPQAAEDVHVYLHDMPVQAWEAWREALGLDPAGSTLRTGSDGRWVSIEGETAALLGVEVLANTVPSPPAPALGEQARQVDPHDVHQVRRLSDAADGGASDG